MDASSRPESVVFDTSIGALAHLICACQASLWSAVVYQHCARFTIDLTALAPGRFEVELYWNEAPKACYNITQLCKMGYYDGTIFHRIIKVYDCPLFPLRCCATFVQRCAPSTLISLSLPGLHDSGWRPDRHRARWCLRLRVCVSTEC